MEKFALLLLVAIISSVLFILALVFALYVILCEYFAFKFNYLRPKKSEVANKSSRYSSATIANDTDGARTTATSSIGATSSDLGKTVI